MNKVCGLEVVGQEIFLYGEEKIYVVDPENFEMSGVLYNALDEPTNQRI
jgi:hypothetical protein